MDQDKEESENVRTGSAGSRKGEAALAPLRTGRETPCDEVLSAIVGEPDTDVQPAQVIVKEPLPPIGKDSEEPRGPSSGKNSPLESVSSSVIATSMAGGTAGQPVSRRPRIIGYKREMDVDEVSVKSGDSRSSHRNVSFKDRSPSTREVHKLKGYDGKEHVMVSVDCQTEWSWVEDMKSRRSGLESVSPPRRLSHGSSRSQVLSSPQFADSEEVWDSDTNLRANLETPNSRLSRGKKTATPKDQESVTFSPTKNKSEAETPGLDLADDASIPQPHPSRADEYGIPMLELSSDSDTSDDESTLPTTREDTGTEDQVPPTPDGLLPSIGPPQILQYKRESEEVDGAIEGEGGLAELGEGGSASMVINSVFEGPCEFCGKQIKPFPSLEDQKTLPPEVLYCCDEYREFVESIMRQQLISEQAKGTQIDIKPHPPYGSKQARRAAKERAAQRMRERELARQQAAVGGLNAPANFYQSREVREGGTTREVHTSGVGGGSVAYGTSVPSYAQLAVARAMKTINYQLSSQKCLEEGWTLRPPSPLQDLEEEEEMFEPVPVLPPWAQSEDKEPKERPLVEKFYEDGNRFLIMFPDGTGSVFYPSGRLAISISSTEEGLFTYIVQDDNEVDWGVKSPVMAVFEPNGHAASYFNHGGIRVYLDPLGGVELDTQGSRKKRWSWKDQVEHVHAPPIQPITFAINRTVAIRIMSQENITLTFAANKRSCRFRVGVTLKLVAKENIPQIEIDEEALYRDEMKTKVQSLLNKVSNLLKFPKSPKLDKLPTPGHLSSRMSRNERRRELAKSQNKDGKPIPVVTVN